MSIAADDDGWPKTCVMANPHARTVVVGVKTSRLTNTALHIIVTVLPTVLVNEQLIPQNQNMYHGNHIQNFDMKVETKTPNQVCATLSEDINN